MVVLEAGQADAAQPVARLVLSLLLGTPRNTGPRATLPTTVFHGSSASAWNMKLVPGAIPSTACPPTRTVPALGRSRPATMVSVVDLPHPVGPTMAQNCPAPMVRSTSRKAVNIDPAGVTNRFVTPVRSICAAWAAVPEGSRAP